MDVSGGYEMGAVLLIGLDYINSYFLNLRLPAFVTMCLTSARFVFLYIYVAYQFDRVN